MPEEKDVVGLLLLGGAVASILLLTRSSGPAGAQPVATASGDPGVDPGGGTVIGKTLPPQTTPYPPNTAPAGMPSSGIPQQPAQPQPTVAQLLAASGPPTAPPNLVPYIPPSGPAPYPNSYLGPLGSLGVVRQVGLPITSNLQSQALAAARAGVIPVVNIPGMGTIAVATPGGPPGGMTVPQINYWVAENARLSAGVRAVQAQQRAATTQLASTLANVPIVGNLLAQSYQQQVAAANAGRPAPTPGINYLGQPYGIASRTTYKPPAPVAPAAAATPPAAPAYRAPIPGRLGGPQI